MEESSVRICMIANVDKIIFVYTQRNKKKKVCKALNWLLVRRKLEMIYNLSNNSDSGINIVTSGVLCIYVYLKIKFI